MAKKTVKVSTPKKVAKKASAPTPAPKKTSNPKTGKLLMPKPATPAAKPKQGGLGRGLDALISAKNTAAQEQAQRNQREGIVASIKGTVSKAAPEANTLQGEMLLNVKPSLIQRSPWQPRGTFDPDSLHELSETIKVHGLIQALTCRRIPESKGGGFELISGERRLRAAIDAGLTEVPIRIINVSDREAAEMAIIENVQRDDLNAIEEAEGYKTLIDNFNLTQQEVADRVGKGRGSIANALRLLDLPDEVKQLVSGGQLSVGHAKVLLSIDDETEQTLLARKCVVDGMSVRSLERSIAKRSAGDHPVTRAPKQDIPETHKKFLLDKMHTYFAAPVRLRPSMTYGNGKRAKGTIEIDFVDNDDLSRILEILGISAD